jgi:NAD(P)H-flavin reductase
MASRCGEDNVVTFHIKDMGHNTWTHALAKLAMGNPHPADITMSIDGPYGNPGRYMEKNTLILTAGGIGITPIHSIVADLYGRATNPESNGSIGNVRTVHVIWSVREAATLYSFANTFAAILADNPNNMFHFHLGCSGPSKGATGIDEAVAAGLCDRASAVALDKIVGTSRPKLAAVYEQVALDAATLTKSSGYSSTQLVGTFVCGPQALITDVSNLAFTHAFDFHTEVFHL